MAKNLIRKLDFGDGSVCSDDISLGTLKTANLNLSSSSSSQVVKKAKLDYTFGTAIDTNAGEEEDIISYHRSDSGIFTVRTVTDTFAICLCLGCTGTLCPDENIKCIFYPQKDTTRRPRPLLYSTTETEWYFGCWCQHCETETALLCTFEYRRKCLRKFFKGRGESELVLPACCVCEWCSLTDSQL
jgi:hypothetical protein